MVSKQKNLLLNILEKTKRPLSRREILMKGRNQMPRLGAATVDRFIKEMCQNLKLVGLCFPGQPTRFELPAEKEHPHFICRSCDKVFDLDIPMTLPKVSLPHGFYLSGGEVVFSGTCPQCESKI